MTHNTREWKEIDDKVCDLMMEFGPDGHIDGHEKLTDYIHHQLQKAREDAQAEYKQFVLNVLDGVDIADGQCNTKAIRFALQSRTIHSELDQEELNKH